MSPHCRQACHRTLVRLVRLWQLPQEQLCQLSLPEQTLVVQHQACREIAGSADVSVVIVVGMVVAARQMAPRSASSVTHQTISTRTTPNRLSPMRLQKGTSSGHHLSPARPLGASPRDL